MLIMFLFIVVIIFFVVFFFCEILGRFSNLWKVVEEMIVMMNEGVVDMLEYKDDGYIEFIFKLLVRICDG